MKKAFLFSLGLILTFSSVFVSCVEDDGLTVYTVSVSSEDNGSASIKDNEATSLSVTQGNRITVVATPNDGYEFVGWFLMDKTTSISIEPTYTFVVSNNISLIAKFELKSIDGYKYVDLGLPSGIKWAMCNVGATSPEDYGNYYTWGSKKHSAGYVSRDSISYNSSIAGNIQYDVATAEWGVEWRIPTKKDFEELFDYCTFKQVRKDGVRGYLVVSKKNDNQIFLPAAGYYFNCRLYNAGYDWHYWSATPLNDLSALCFYSEKDQSFMLFPLGRDVGRNIRPVYVGGK